MSRNPASPSLALALCLGLSALSAPTPAQAWWHLWRAEPVEEPPIPPIPTPLQKLRDGGCAVGDADGTRFGDTAFMRGHADKSILPEDMQRALLGLTITDDADAARAYVAPFLSDSDPVIQGHARVALARWHLAHASRNAAGSSTAKALLDHPSTATMPDAHYLRAVIAMAGNDWDGARDQASAALTDSPDHYDAQVLLALTALRGISIRPQSCGAAMTAIQTVLVPVLSSGACPTHVAHFDLAARRFLPPVRGQHGERDARLRAIVLAFVARNDRECARQAELLRQAPGGGDCGLALASLPCTSGATVGAAEGQQ